MDSLPLNKRLNVSKKIIFDDFPFSAKVAFYYLVQDLKKKNYIWDNQALLLEIKRIERYTVSEDQKKESLSELIVKLDWISSLNLIERIYEKLLSSVGDSFNEYYIPLEDVREYYSNEINQILNEENLGFAFNNGRFVRKFRSQTAKNIRNSNKVLDDPRLESTKKHFNKALDFYNKYPTADTENSVKEAICALEACVESLFSISASNNFDKAVNKLQGNESGKIPAPILESMKKFYSYRGSSIGVAHAATEGNRVSLHEAELALSLSATYITYLYDISQNNSDIPF